MTENKPVYINETDLYDFAIYLTDYDKFRVQCQINKESLIKCFETKEECHMYLKEILGEEEYNKRRYFAYNNNYYKALKPLLSPYQVKIMEAIVAKFRNILTSGNNTNRISHIKKIKTITIKDLYEKLCENKWRCLFSNLEFSFNKQYLQPSIDRLDSTKPYTKENTAIVIELVQNLKNSYTITEFMRGVSSISTNTLIPSSIEDRNTLIGGPKDKKGSKSWKQITLSKPIHMSPSQAYIYEIQHNEPSWKTVRELYESINKRFNKTFGKGTTSHSLNDLVKRGYMEKKTVLSPQKHYEFKLKSTEEIIAVNNDIEIDCGQCKNKENIIQYRARESRSKKTEIDCNMFYTICRKCNTSCTNKCTNKDPRSFIMRLISGRKEKKGDINKDNIKEIITEICDISGLPIIYEKNAGWFNQASPDRIDSNGNYDIKNTRVVCLMLNLGRNNYDITDEELLFIIKSIYTHRSL